MQQRVQLVVTMRRIHLVEFPIRCYYIYQHDVDDREVRQKEG
jgi:hypothetical protein